MILRILSFTALFGGLLAAHGVDLQVQKAPNAVAVRFGYGPADPAKGAPVAVYSPAAPAEPFQAGHTDQHGLFVFVPDRPGEWRVVADDGEGHREEARIAVSDAGAIQFEAHSHSRPGTLITGLSLLVGLTGIALWWSGRRRPGNSA